MMNKIVWIHTNEILPNPNIDFKKITALNLSCFLVMCEQCENEFKVQRG